MNIFGSQPLVGDVLRLFFCVGVAVKTLIARLLQ